MVESCTADRPLGISVEQALLLYSLGFSIFPVPLPIPGTPPNFVGDGKVPAVEWKLYRELRATEAQIGQWFRTPHNAAIVTGSISNTVVVDCDSDQALAWATKRLPWTPRQVKTSKGWHLYYLHPDEPVRNKVRVQTGDGKIALDVRGDGGFVIAPFSVHMCGEMYHPVGDWDAPAESVPVYNPAWLERRSLPSVAREKPAHTYTSTVPVLDRARKYLASIPRPEIGMGSDAASFFAACRMVRGFALPEADAVALLEDWAGGRPGWDSEWLATKVRHALKYGTEPIGGLL